MDGRLLLLLLLSVCSPVLGTWDGCGRDKDDIKCPKCRPIRPIKDFDEEKVNKSNYFTCASALYVYPTIYK